MPVPLRRRARRPLLVLTALVAVFLVTIDGASYAATGASLVLGRLNTAGATTTVVNSGAGPALRLLTFSPTSAPFTTNSTGKVARLNADRLDGLEPGEIAALAPVPRFTFVRTTVTQTPNPGAFAGVLSASGAAPGTYRLSGSVTVPCTAGNTSGYLVDLLVVRSPTDVTPLGAALAIPAARCGQPTTMAVRARMEPTARLLLRVHDIDAGDLVALPLSFSLTGVPVTAAL